MPWYDTYVTYVSYHDVFLGNSKVLFQDSTFKILRTRSTKDTSLYLKISFLTPMNLKGSVIITSRIECMNKIFDDFPALLFVTFKVTVKNNKTG
jgi:hypothetical protein